jgi:putative ABC transport system permease protein
MGTLMQDIRYGLRMLAKSPGFTLIAVVTLALGIGLNAAIFSVVYAVVLNPLPYRQPDRLVTVTNVDTLRHLRFSSFSYPNFEDVKTQNRSFESIGVAHTGDATLTGIGRPERVQTAIISPDLIEMLGIPPLMGRNTFPEVGQSGKPRGGTEAIVSQRFWQSRLGADPKALGRSITLDDKPYTIVGVMPARFEFPLQAEPVEVWLSSAVLMETTDNEPPMTANRGADFLDVVARLKPGVSQSQAQANVETIGAALAKQYPDTNRHRTFAVEGLKEHLVGQTRRTLIILFGAVGCLLLMACANVANLLLARATTRSKEIAVRSALGASRGRIVAQLLTESILLAVGGGIAGLIFFVWAQVMLLGFAPANIPRVGQTGLNLWVLGFTMMVSVLTGMIFGLAPALHVASPQLAETLKEGGRTATTASGNRIRAVLMTAQFGIAVVLLIGAGLLIRSLVRLESVSPGFRPEYVLTVDIGLPDAHYTAEQQYAFFDQLKARLDALPGVRSASAVYPLPLSDNNMDIMDITFEVEGRTVAKSEEPVTNMRVVEPGYFETVGIPLVRGRDFTPRDQEKTLQVVIVNQTLARTIFGKDDPIGKHIRVEINTLPGSKRQMQEIVGVVGDVHHRSLHSESGMEAYRPETQVPFDELSVVVRTDGDPRALASAVREQVSQLDPQLSVARIYPMEHYVAASLAEPRLDTVLLGVFAAVALLLTAIGLFGMMAYTVAQRTHEIGIRVALGAQPSDVMRQIIQQAARLALVGLAVGLPAAFVLTRLMESLLFGVSATDPPTFVGVALLVAGVSLVAAVVPARRAMRVDPMVALRYE